MPTGCVRVGISGFRYAEWRGSFYPKGLPQKQELRFASERLRSIELNGSFYSLKTPESYRTWYEQTPGGFLFSVKGGRYITHMRKLREVQKPLANFFASGVLELKEKLGPLLWQFPAQLAFDERFEAFFRLLPKDTAEAAKLASQHDARVRRFAPPDGPVRPLRHTIEVRHTSFECAEFIQLLRRFGFALTISDSAGKFPHFEDVTAPFVYIRLHGSKQLYASRYSASELDLWARKIRAWSRGREPRDARRVAPRAGVGAARDVYVYFDNDMKAYAPFDAMSLIAKLRL